MPGPDIWAYLLDGLLHKIIAVLSSFHDLLAFTATCRSWRAALSSLPYLYNFTFPPLLLKPNINHELLFSNKIKYEHLFGYKWSLCDPAKRTLSLRRSAPWNNSSHMCYLGCSYGYLIFTYHGHCLLVNVYTGTNVKTPKLRSTSNCQIDYGILAEPLDSPNSHLILCSASSMFWWKVGTESWSEHPLGGVRIMQIIFLKGGMFAMDFLHRLHTICMAPQFSMQEVHVREEDNIAGLRYKPWLVVCGDMLLLVTLSEGRSMSSSSFTFQVFHLDCSVRPAMWVKMEELGNWSLFVCIDRRNPTFSCMNPERWGGKSNFIYCAVQSGDEPWTVAQLGQAVPMDGSLILLAANSNTLAVPSKFFGYLNLQDKNLWVLPSLSYGVGQ